MKLIQTLSVIILVLFCAHFIMVNVLNIPYRDLVKTPGHIELSSIESQLKSDFGVSQQGGKITNLLPDKFIEQAIYDPNRERSGEVSPANEGLYDKEADFGNEQTNISQFFATNPGVFFNDQRHNAYVPDVAQWSSAGNTMYTQMINAPRSQINPYGYDKLQLSKI